MAEFNVEEQRTIIKLCVTLGKSSVDTMKMLFEATGQPSVCRSLVYKWQRRFSDEKKKLNWRRFQIWSARTYQRGFDGFGAGYDRGGPPSEHSRAVGPIWCRTNNDWCHFEGKTGNEQRLCEMDTTDSDRGGYRQRWSFCVINALIGISS